MREASGQLVGQHPEAVPICVCAEQGKGLPPVTHRSDLDQPCVITLDVGTDDGLCGEGHRGESQPGISHAYDTMPSEFGASDPVTPLS